MSIKEESRKVRFKGEGHHIFPWKSKEDINTRDWQGSKKKEKILTWFRNSRAWSITNYSSSQACGECRSPRVRGDPASIPEEQFPTLMIEVVLETLLSKSMRSRRRRRVKFYSWRRWYWERKCWWRGTNWKFSQRTHWAASHNPSRRTSVDPSELSCANPG